MAEHRVPMLGSSWRRNDDPASSRDPQVRALVSALATLPAPQMRPEFRAELRTQLVAIAPRLVNDGIEAETMVDIVPGTVRSRPTPHGRAATGAATPAVPAPVTKPAAPPRHSDSALDRFRGLRFGRPLTVAASVIVTLTLMLGGAVWMSKKSLPGDALYGLKRASERAQLAIAGSDTKKARDYLDFAKTRADEVQSLLSRSTTSASGARVSAAGGIDAGTASLINSTLGSADADVRAAARLLGSHAVRSHSASPLATMTSWGPGQLKRLSEIVAAMPDPALRGRARSSAELVRSALARADALASRMGCSCLSVHHQDALGPVPCDVCAAPVTPGPATHPVRPRSTGRPATGNLPGGKPSKESAQSGARNGKVAPGASSSPTPSPTPTSPSPGAHLPSLPVPTVSPTLPVDLNSCGATVSLPLLGGVDLNLCDGLHVSVGK